MPAFPPPHDSWACSLPERQRRSWACGSQKVYSFLRMPLHLASLWCLLSCNADHSLHRALGTGRSVTREGRWSQGRTGLGTLGTGSPFLLRASLLSDLGARSQSPGPAPGPGRPPPVCLPVLCRGGRRPPVSPARSGTANHPGSWDNQASLATDGFSRFVPVSSSEWKRTSFVSSDWKSPRRHPDRPAGATAPSRTTRCC